MSLEHEGRWDARLAIAVWAAMFCCTQGGCARAPARDGPNAGPAPLAGAGGTLFPICERSLSGYIDRTGAVVVPPRFTLAKDFDRGFAQVWVVDPQQPGEEVRSFCWATARHPCRGRAGLVDASGRVALDLAFDKVLAPTEGLVAARRNGRWGFVDLNGVVRIPFRYLGVEPFSEGLARVTDEQGRRFVDASDRTRIEFTRLRWRHAGREVPVVAESSFSDGLAVIRAELGVYEKPALLYGFMDREGRIAIEPAFTHARAFHGGYALVQVACEPHGQCYGVLRPSGEWAIPPTYPRMQPMHDGLASFSTKVEGRLRCGYLNERNEVAIPPRYDQCEEFCGEGSCQVREGGRHLYVDLGGAEAIVLPSDVTFTGRFSHGLARIKSERGEYFIRRDGTPVFEGRFKEVQPFNNGLARVFFHDDRLGYVDPEGRVVYRQAELCRPPWESVAPP